MSRERERKRETETENTALLSSPNYNTMAVGPVLPTNVEKQKIHQTEAQFGVPRRQIATRVSDDLFTFWKRRVNPPFASKKGG